MYIVRTLKSRSFLVFTKLVFEKLFVRTYSSFNSIRHLFNDKLGVEIGGPSLFFADKGFLPVYSIASNIDGCNFSPQTVWEGEIAEGKTYRYADNKYGHQFICDGVNVPVLPKGVYDFVLSCNNLEHIANPLKAINNWINLLKDKGAIVLVLPKKQSNFDHKRPVTSFDHLLDDYNNNRGEDDLTHLPEILELHDLTLDPLTNGYNEFKKRGKDNVTNRCLHHHVFDLDLLKQAFDYFGLTTVVAITRVTDHVVIAEKSKRTKNSTIKEYNA